MQNFDVQTAIEEALQSANNPDSHSELDAFTFHPSQLGMCRRQAFLSKLGLLDQSDSLGYFQAGTLIHEFLEEELSQLYPHLWYEYPVVHSAEDIKIVGQADLVDPEHGVVYDFKTRGGWYNFNPPKDSHLDQIHCYMAAVGATRAQIVYINKKDLSDIRPWPAWDDDVDQAYVRFDPDRFQNVLSKAIEIQETIKQTGVPQSPEEIPFSKCDCYQCDQETLDLPENPPTIDESTPSTPALFG